MAWFRVNRRRSDRSVARISASPAVALQRRIAGCIAARDPAAALDAAALAEASAVLDEQLGRLTTGTDTVDVTAITTVANLHRVRSIALDHPPEEAHAAVALQVLVHTIDPSAVPPHTYEEVTNAISRGAATDPPTAMLRATQGHASAVRASWRRRADPQLADTFVRAFARLVEIAGPDVPNVPTRLLDLAAALAARYRSREPHGDPADLRTAVQLTDQALSAAAADTAAVRRAHKLRGPILVGLGEIEPGCGALHQAVESFARIVELTEPTDVAYDYHRLRLADAQRLLDRASTPPGSASR